jgi:hypothetical protein
MKGGSSVLRLFESKSSLYSIKFCVFKKSMPHMLLKQGCESRSILDVDDIYYVKKSENLLSNNRKEQSD